jgi:hypothetical protein
MPRPLDPRSKNILEFQPQIGPVEPEVQPGVIDPITPDQPQLEDIYAEVDELEKLADAVNTLATAAQARIDEIAADIKMAVTEDDEAVLQAMARLFPDDDPTEITFKQYRACKDRIIQEGIDIGAQLIITPDEISALKDCASKAIDNETSNCVTQMGGFGTPESKDGRQRPELQKRGMIIKPLNYKKLQAKLLCMLANELWKKFILPAFGISIAGVGVKNLLPKKLCNAGKGLELPNPVKLIKKGAKDFKKTAGKATAMKPKK